MKTAYKKSVDVERVQQAFARKHLHVRRFVRDTLRKQPRLSSATTSLSDTIQLLPKNFQPLLNKGRKS